MRSRFARIGRSSCARRRVHIAISARPTAPKAQSADNSRLCSRRKHRETYTTMPTNTLHTPVTLNTEDTLNAIVAHYPQTLPVLQRFGLDTCCGGALPLHTAAQHHG